MNSRWFPKLLASIALVFSLTWGEGSLAAAPGSETTLTLGVYGVYYVSPAGNDANLGTESKPWRTIQKAADTLAAGDTVYIKTGVYAEMVEPQNSGSAGHYIGYAHS